MLKKYTLKPEITLLYQFHAQKALFKVPKICNKIFWIANDPSPTLDLFGKFILLVALPIHKCTLIFKLTSSKKMCNKSS